MSTELYVNPHHRVPDDEWAAVVRRAQEIHEEALANKTGGAASPAGPIIDFRGRSNKHSGVSGLRTQLLVLHSAECPLRGGYAQSLTEWAITSAVIASWQRFVDPIARVYMIDDNYAAWHASEANPMSIGWEQAGYARFSRAEWTTPDGMLQMESLAYDMAQVALRDGINPAWLTTAQVTAITSGRDTTTTGFCAHRQIDPESRTDPGNGYPYDLLMQKICGYMGAGTITSHSTTTPTASQEDDLTPDEAHQLARVFQMVSNLDENHLMNRVINIDNRVALLVKDIAYVKSADSPTLYERNGEDNTLRPITLTEWELTGKPYVTYPQAKFNELFKKG